MDLIPKPDQVIAATGNVLRQVVNGGIADLRPMARTPLGGNGDVLHLDPAEGAPPTGDPVLLVPPPGVPPEVFDLRRGCSLAEHLVAAGRPTYLLEYGEVDVRDRDLDLRPWVDEVVPTAIERVSAHAGGRPVHVVGWSLGGTLAVLAAAGRTALPVASLTLAGSPTDVSSVPLLAPRRPLVSELPVPLLGRVLRLGPVEGLLDRPLATALHLDDADYLAQLEAVGRITGGMDAYAGRHYGQLLHRFAPGNALAGGSVELGGRTVSLSAVTAPVLVLAGATDAIAPVDAVRAVIPHLSASREVQVEVVPGGHLGLLTGRAARTGTWPVLDDWFDRWTSPAKKAAPRKRAPRKKAASKKAASEKAASKDMIGSNPGRRYGSGGSRALSR